MDHQKIRKWVEQLRSKETRELIKALSEEDPSKYPEPAVDAIRQILAGREAKRPSAQTHLAVARAKSAIAEFRSLPLMSNAQVRVSGSKCEIKFAKSDFLIPERNEFRDWDDVFNYVADTFSLPNQQDFRYSMTRRGKYQRLDPKRNPIFTFGDPILDLITDEQGLIVIGDECYNLRRMRRAVPIERRGGICSLDLTPHLKDIKQAQIAEAMARGEKFILQESADGAVAISSRNPSTQWFHKGDASMRFRAWKDDYAVYWSMGAEIETWGEDFGHASIESNYGADIAQGFCATMKHDSDSETNDDYVDESEWGIASSAPTGVRSWCTAQWKGKLYSAWVEAGDCHSFFA